jgi:hypothetical protein
MTTIRFQGREIPVPDKDIDSFDKRLGGAMLKLYEKEISLEQATRELGLPSEIVRHYYTCACAVAETDPTLQMMFDELRAQREQREEALEQARDALAYAASTKEGRDFFRKKTGKELVPVTDYYQRRFQNTERFPTTESEMRKCIAFGSDSVEGVLVCDAGHPMLEYYKSVVAIRE